MGTGALAHDINRWWYRLRGKEDPYLKIGDLNDRTISGASEYVWALKDINFEVKHGEVLGIIGKNGAGKSTLLKILSRTTSPSTGTVKIKGRVASLLEVGTGFHPELSGRENIFLNGAILGMTRKEIARKFDEIVDFAGVERYIDTPVKRYSSGMYVRLAFAVAAHLEPEILIVDEVLAVGDAEFQKKCIGKMKDASENEGRTVLFVSHDMEAISRLTSHSMLLSNGSIAFNGKTEECIKHYMNLNIKKNHVYENNTISPKPYIQKVALTTSLPNNVQLNGGQLKIDIDLFTPYPIKGACFSFQIIDSKERNFSHLWVFDTDIPYCRESGLFRLTCTIPSLRLYMGDYMLRCYFSEPPGGELFDMISNICPFEVVMYETKRSDFTWQPEACAYIEEAEWAVHKQ